MIKHCVQEFPSAVATFPAKSNVHILYAGKFNGDGEKADAGLIFHNYYLNQIVFADSTWH